MKRKPKRDTTHIVINSNTSRFECKACGMSHPYELPMSVDMFTGLIKLFVTEHAHCAARPAKEAPDEVELTP